MLRRRLPVALLAACALLLAGCGRETPVGAPGGKLEASAVTSAGEEGTVGLRVYLRAGEGHEAYLQPVTRTAPISGELPRRALELLIAGPLVEDAGTAELRAPLPQSTVVQAFTVEGDTAVVDLSAHAIADAARVDPRPEHELLALAAIANTLTEFPEIDHVRLTVDGTGGAFWGGWGLPELLSRDERVIGPARASNTLPPLQHFGQEPQQIGSADAGPVAIKDVRTLDRVGFLRVEVELAGADGEQPAAGVPVTTARLEGERLVLEFADVLSSAGNLQPGARLTLANLPFQAVEAEPGELPGLLRFALVPGARPFWLHTLTSPTRVVLDVRK